MVLGHFTFGLEHHFRNGLDGVFRNTTKEEALKTFQGLWALQRQLEMVDADENRKIQDMRDHVIERVLSEIPQTILNGHPMLRTPQNANISFSYVEGRIYNPALGYEGLCSKHRFSMFQPIPTG